MQYFAKLFHSNCDLKVPGFKACGTFSSRPLSGVLFETFKVSKIGKNGFKVKSETASGSLYLLVAPGWWE